MEDRVNAKMFWAYMLVGLLLVLISLGFGRLSYGVVMPFMQDGLRLSYAQAGFLGTITSLGYLATVLLAGWLAARWGNKQTVVLGCSLLVLSMLGLSSSNGYGVAMVAMFGAGVGSGMVFTPALSLMVGWFPERRGLAAGFLMSGTGLAMVLSGLIVPAVSTGVADGWRWVWRGFAAAALLVFLLAAWLLRNPPSAASAAARSGGLSVSEQVYRNPGVLRVAGMYFSFGIAYLVPSTFQMSYMLAQQIASTTAGMLTAMGGVLSLASSPVWGWVSDRIGRQRTLVAAFATVMVALLIPVLYPKLLGFFLSQLLSGSTIAAIPALIQASASEQVPPVLVPVALGYVTIFFSVGQLVGPGLGGWFIDHVMGFPSAYLFTILMLSLGLALAYGMRAPARAHEETRPLASRTDELHR
jgi:MFS family permease